MNGRFGFTLFFALARCSLVSAMAIEVEQKFRLVDCEAFERRLDGLVAHAEEPIEQVDMYYAHPARDFAGTDEALRIRRVGADNYITYKGAKLDRFTKTRREIEVPLSAGAAAATDADALLAALGFTRVAEVRKRRRHFTVVWHDREIVVAVDQVDEVGPFVELEIVADEAGVAAAREAIVALAEHLGLANGERRSYLELLLEGRRASGSPS